MKEHPSLIKPLPLEKTAVAKSTRSIIIREERIPKAYEAYRNTVLNLLEKTKQSFLEVERANSIEEIRELLNNNDVQFMRLAANLEKLIPFFDKLVANADLEKEVLEKLNKELTKLGS